MTTRHPAASPNDKPMIDLELDIHLARADAEILACWQVMHELRPAIRERDFVARVRRQEATGYRLAYLKVPEGVIAVAGFRILENLAWGLFLYVDDLVTAAAHRSRGHGGVLLDWLVDHAAEQGCGQLHLDSGLQREQAHRFYQREGVAITGYHFAAELPARAG